jgi:hypothetical protein
MNRWELMSAGGTMMILFVPLFIALSGKHWREAQEKARERRMAEHRMNARLLRMDI